MSKLYQTFQPSYSLHKPPQTILFRTTFLSDVVTSSFLWTLQSRNSSLTKTSGSCFFLLQKYLTVVNLSNNTLSHNHSIMYVCCWQRNQRAFNENVFATLHQGHLTPETFVFLSALCLSFVFFVFVFWSIETTTTNVLGLTH